MHPSPPPSLPLLSIVNSHLPSPLLPLLPLTPDRPAHSYQLSYTKYHESKLHSKLSQTQRQQLLLQVQQLKQQLSRSMAHSKSIESSYQEKLLLMSVQVQRVRTIMKEQGETIERVKREWNQLQNIYRLKLEQTKHDLTSTFQSQLSQRTQQSSSIIEQVRQLYIDKIATLTQGYEERLKQKEMEMGDKDGERVRLQISELKESGLEGRVEGLKRENQRLEGEVWGLKRRVEEEVRRAKELEEQVRRRREEEEDQREKVNIDANTLMMINNNNNPNNPSPPHINNPSPSTNNPNPPSHLLQQQLHQLTLTTQQAHLSHQQQLTQLFQTIQQKDQQLQLTRWKCHKLELQLRKLQAELNEFKNRKTTSNEVVGRDKKAGFFVSNSSGSGVSGGNLIGSGAGNLGNLGIVGSANNTHNNTHNNNSNNSRTEKELPLEEPKRQTEERISYQQSLKKRHQLQTKLEQLNLQLNKKDQLLSEQQDQIGQMNRQLGSVKKLLSEKEGQIRVLLMEKQQLSVQTRGDKPQQSSLSPLPQQQPPTSQLLQQKQHLILQLTRQLQQKTLLMTKLQKELQKSTKRQKQLKQTITQTQQNFTIKLKGKQNQLKAKESEIRLKESQLRVRENQVKVKGEECKGLAEEVRKKEEEMRIMKEDNKQKEDELRKKEEQLRRKEGEVQQLSNQLQLLNQQVNKPKQKPLSNGQLEKSIRQRVVIKQQQAIKDPFADPFSEDPYAITDDRTNNPTAFNHSSPLSPSSLSQKLAHYQQTITHLQTQVQSLTFDWSTTQQNENAIFTSIKATYVEQIKELREKNEESERIIKSLEEMVEQMAKKQSAEGLGYGGEVGGGGVGGTGGKAGGGSKGKK